MVAAKALNLTSIIRGGETEKNHAKNSKKRRQLYQKVLIPIYILLFILTCLRYIDTCYFYNEFKITRAIYPSTILSTFYTIKLFSVIFITSCLLFLRTNEHFSKFKSRVLIFIVSSVLICVDLIGFIIIIAFRTISAS